MALRVAFKCSQCNRQTSGPTDEPDGRVLIGVAAHICAASPGGPRYDPSQTTQQRRSIENGIWLCANCAKLIDDDVSRFSVHDLHRIKKNAENLAHDELKLSVTGDRDDWRAFQISSIATFATPLEFPLSGTKKIDQIYFETFNNTLHECLARALGHVAMTNVDDFVFLMSLEPDDRETETGYVPFILSLHCHITAFLWAFEEFWKLRVEGSIQQTSSRIEKLPGDQTLHMHSKFGRLVPHRICRCGSTNLLIQELSGRPMPMNRSVTTSTFLRIMAVILNSGLVIWDHADDCPDFEKILSIIGSIADSESFSWDQIRISRSNPEKWKYVRDFG